MRESELPKDGFAGAVEDCKNVLRAIGVPLAGFQGSGQPIFSEDAIVFNGAAGAGCEPFEIHQIEFDRLGRKVVRGFCKTEHAPYDICVQAALIVLKHHLGKGIAVISDATDRDWEEARMACQLHLGYGENFALEKD